ncbi:hypothetical protein SK128_028644, partial [Halocaridina rubra]
VMMVFLQNFVGSCFLLDYLLFSVFPLAPLPLSPSSSFACPLNFLLLTSPVRGGIKKGVYLRVSSVLKKCEWL